MALRQMIKNMPQILLKTVFWIVTVLLSWCMQIESNDITPANSQN